MAERRVAKIMGKAQRLCQILVDRQKPRHGARDLGDFERMSEPRAIIVPFVLHENLRFVFKTPECRRMDDPVAIALVTASGRTFGFGINRPRLVAARLA